MLEYFFINIIILVCVFQNTVRIKFLPEVTKNKDTESNLEFISQNCVVHILCKHISDAIYNVCSLML